MNETVSDDLYFCAQNEDSQCASTCASFYECSACACVTRTQEAGPWGSVVDVLLSLFPVVFLVYVTVHPRHSLPTSSSLPLSACLLYLIRTMYLGSDPLLVTAAVVRGLHEALTPLSIMAGAMILFETMEATRCLPYLMSRVKILTAGHAVAEAMLLFSFCYMVEGASGFGTPAALGAPLLVSSGHDALASVVVLLIFNTTATIFGAVGTPIWFGVGQTVSDDWVLHRTGQQAAVTMAIVSLVVVPWVLTVLVPRRCVRNNLGFVYASLLGTVGPALGVAFLSYEFPTLLGGIVGCLVTSLLIRYKIFLVKPEQLDRDCLELGAVSEHSIVRQWQRAVSSMSERDGEPLTTIPEGNNDDEKTENSATDAVDESDEEEQVPSQRDYLEEKLGSPTSSPCGELLARSFPLWGSVLLLLLTRLDQIGLKRILQLQDPSLEIGLGTYGTFRLSASLVFQLRNILSYPGMNWRYEVLYVPFVLPFVVVSVLSYSIFRKDAEVPMRNIFGTVARRLQKPALALMGALALVQLMIRQGDESPAFVIGSNLSKWLRQGFVVFSPLLGALGSFFSGSTTVSNLTFSQVQSVAAELIGLPKENLLALQVLGATAGNGICLNNIIAVCAVVGLNTGEGPILMRTAKFVFAETSLATVVMLAIFIRF